MWCTCGRTHVCKFDPRSAETFRSYAPISGRWGRGHGANGSPNDRPLPPERRIKLLGEERAENLLALDKWSTPSPDKT